MSSVAGPRADPAPLFDMVTGFPPDDALDVTLPTPLSLAVYMTVLESTGHAAELAVLRKVHIEQARESMRSLRDGVGAPGPDGSASGPLRITHIVDERVPRTNGLRPHVHAYVGSSVRSPADGRVTPVDVAALTELVDGPLLAGWREGLAAATAASGTLVWGEVSWSPCEIVEPRWLADRVAGMCHDEPLCRGPWPRHQIVAGQASARDRTPTFD